MQNCLCAVDSVLWKCCVWQADSGHVTSLAASSVAVAATVQPDHTVLQHEEVQRSSPRGQALRIKSRAIFIQDIGMQHPTHLLIYKHCLFFSEQIQCLPKAWLQKPSTLKRRKF